jgi:hypothetical protein
MAKRKRLFNLRLSDKEHLVLTLYAAQVRMTAAEVIRDFIKSLERRVKDRERLEGC